MKRFTRFWLIVCLGLCVGMRGHVAGAPAPGAAAPAGTEVIARLHYGGLQRVNADASGSVFKEIRDLPASLQLKDAVLDKLAATMGAWFQPKTTGGNSCSGLIRPLLSDLPAAELTGEAIEHPQAVLEVTFALRLPEARHQLWQKTWTQILAGWEMRKGLGQISYVATNSWFALHYISGPESAAPGDAATHRSMFQRLAQGQRPAPASPEYWLRLEGDLARWAPRLFAAKPGNLPRVDLTLNGRKEYLRSEARLTFREPLSARPEKWQIPTDTIRDPLISFTAVQGVANWLKGQPYIQELGLNTTPNQLFVWGLSQTAFQIQAAVAIQNAETAFERIADKWMPKWNPVLEDHAVGNIRRLTNRTELIWRGLPILVPYLEPVRDGNREYLHSGIFPVKPPTNPPPAALFQQLTGQTNLLYYDWEITQARLEQLRPLLQVASVFLTVSPMATNSPSYQWLDAVQGNLGNAITEVSMTSPRELKIIRNSHLGLNGLELLTLANWIERTNFPHVDFGIGLQPAAPPARHKDKR